MASFLEGLGESVNRAFCSILGGYTNQVELYRYILEPTGLPIDNIPGILYTQNCPYPNPPPPQAESPGFSGGQCEGVSYRVQGTYSVPYTGPGGPFDPITGSFNRVGMGKFVGMRSGSDEGQRTLSAIFEGGAVVDQFASFGSTTIRGDVSTVITSVARVDGLPDTCGDPPPVIPPYTPGGNTYNDNVTYIDNSNNSVSVPVTIALGYATLNVDGTVSIPINAQFSANPTFNGNFNFNLNNGTLQPDVSNPSAPLPSPCSDPSGYKPDPSIPLPPDSIPDVDPLPPATDSPTQRRQLLKGCIVTTSILDGNETVIFQADNPDIYVPSLGYVQFQIQVGDSSAWTNDIPVKCLRTFIPCPWDAGAVDVKGTPRFGNVFVVTPIYVTRTFNPTYPPES